MNDRSKYLAKNTAIFAIGSLGTKLIAFFLGPFYSYVLEREEFGTTDLIFTISTVIVPLIMFNLGEAVRRFCLDQDVDYQKIFDISLITFAFGTVVALLIFPIAGLFPVIAEYRLYLYLYVVLFAIKQICLDFLRGREQLKLYSGSNILYSLLIAVLNILFLAVYKMGVEGYLMAYIISEALVIVFVFLAGRLYKLIRRPRIDRQLARKMILFSLAVVPNSLLWWVVNSSDRVMVTAMRGLSEQGLLGMGAKIPSILTLVNTVFLQAWQYSAIREKDSDTKDEYTNDMFSQFVKASVLVAGSLILVVRPLTWLLYEKSYYESWQSSIFLLLGFVFMGVSTFIGTAYYVEKNMVGNMLSALSGAIANLFLNWLLIPKMGAAGATLAACISYVIILVYRHIDTKKYQNIKLIRKDYLVMTGLLIVMTVLNFVKGYAAIGGMAAAYLVLLAMNYSYVKGIVVKAFGEGMKFLKRLRHRSAEQGDAK
ncbi:MAG: polysaccharide biosynthesis C-terminal domain-containing protein [Oscillospiraceae bacterium]|nr:polysaccharide biosynthesis C-terminal domain-containing protein [Oscillospiraceae bacterium]